MSDKITWVNCPVCGDSDMQKEDCGEGDSIISCTNHACASNGGDNWSAIKPLVEREIRRDDKQTVRRRDVMAAFLGVIVRITKGNWEDVRKQNLYAMQLFERWVATRPEKKSIEKGDYEK